MLIHKMKHVACHGVLNLCRSVREHRAELAEVNVVDKHPDGNALVFLDVVFDAARMHMALLLDSFRKTGDGFDDVQRGTLIVAFDAEVGIWLVRIGLGKTISENGLQMAFHRDDGLEDRLLDLHLKKVEPPDFLEAGSSDVLLAAFQKELSISVDDIVIIIRQQVEFRGLFVFDNEPATFEQIDLLVDGLEFFQQEKAPST